MLIITFVHLDKLQLWFISFQARLWRKTRSELEDTDCLGVDGNRNWGVHFGGTSHLGT